MPFPPIPKEYSIEHLKRNPSQDEVVLFKTIQENIHSLFLYLQRLRDGSLDETSSNIMADPSVVRVVVLGTFQDSSTIDFTIASDGSTLIAVIKPLSITSGFIADGAVLFSKIQDITNARLLGNNSGATDSVSEIQVTGGVEFNANTIRSSEYSGDVTKTAGGVILTIPTNSLAHTKLVQVAASRLIGRGSSAGTGDRQELTVSNGLAISGTVLQSTIFIQRVSSQFDKTDTTLATITGLSLNVEAAGVYSFRADLFVDADVVGGTKYAIAGTATATSIIYQIRLFDNGTNALTINARHTSLGGNTGQAGTTAGLAIITGTIVVNAAGTLLVQFAQNAANNTSSVLINSTFRLERVS